MTDDGSIPSATVWPLPKFHFQVRWDGDVMSFQEVTGLDAEAQPSEYRFGDSKVFSVASMPGHVGYGTVTLKTGVFARDNSFWKWLEEIKMKTITRKAVTISLLDEEENSIMVWSLVNAWPRKVTGTDLKSQGNDVAVESIELVHEGFTVANE